MAQQSEGTENGIKSSFLAEYVEKSDRADKRREHHRHEQQTRQCPLAWKIEALADPGQRSRNCERQGSAAGGKFQRVDEALPVNRVAKYFDQVVKRKRASLIEKCSPENNEDRPDKEEPEERKI